MSTNMTRDYEHEAVLNTVSNVTKSQNSTQLEVLLWNVQQLPVALTTLQQSYTTTAKDHLTILQHRTRYCKWRQQIPR